MILVARPVRPAPNTSVATFHRIHPGRSRCRSDPEIGLRVDGSGVCDEKTPLCPVERREDLLAQCFYLGGEVGPMGVVRYDTGQSGKMEDIDLIDPL